jgi:integrase
LERATRRGRKRSTLLDYRQVLDTYLTSGNGNVSRLGIKRAPFVNQPIASLDNQAATIIVREWFDSQPPSRTRDKLLTITRGILRFAVAEGYVATNVALRVDRHHQGYDGSYDYYDVAEIRELLAAATNELDRVLFATASMAGLRRGELIGLHWRNIDWQGHKINVQGNVSRGRLVSTKSGHHRVVPLVPELAELLATIAPADNMAGKAATKRSAASGLVFPGTDGSYQDPSALRRRYIKAVKTAGLRQLPFHSLRHAFASTAIQVASIQQVKDWCGHSSIVTTSRYLHSRSSVDDATLLAQGFAA